MKRIIQLGVLVIGIAAVVYLNFPKQDEDLEDAQVDAGIIYDRVAAPSTVNANEYKENISSEYISTIKKQAFELRLKEIKKQTALIDSEIKRAQINEKLADNELATSMLNIKKLQSNLAAGPIVGDAGKGYDFSSSGKDNNGERENAIDETRMAITDTPEASALVNRILSDNSAFITVNGDIRNVIEGEVFSGVKIEKIDKKNRTVKIKGMATGESITLRLSSMGISERDNNNYSDSLSKSRRATTNQNSNSTTGNAPTEPPTPTQVNVPESFEINQLRNLINAN